MAPICVAPSGCSAGIRQALHDDITQKLQELLGRQRGGFVLAEPPEAEPASRGHRAVDPKVRKPLTAAKA